MTCPVCEGKTKTNNSAEVYGSVIRRRTCTSCGYVFFTEEQDVPEEDVPKFRSLLVEKRRAQYRDSKRRRKREAEK